MARWRMLGLGVLAGALLGIVAWAGRSPVVVAPTPATTPESGAHTPTIASQPASARSEGLGPEARIGLVYPITGRLADANAWGQEGIPIARLAEADVSDLAEAQAAGVRFRVVVRSSESSPQGALEAVSSLVERDGVSLIVGLPTSAELGGALAYLIDHDVAAISSASTAPDPRLMQPDTVYRLMPSELYLARRLAGLALDQGYTRAALIFRTDGWGDRYAAQVQAVFGDRGFPAVGVPITPTHPRVTDYASEVAALSDEVAKLGADERTVVIMAVWEGEDLNILHHAGQDQRLSRVRWLSAVLYPSLRDGTFGAPDMELPDASDFAFEHRLWGQEFLPQPSAEVQRLFLATKRELGRQPRFEHVFLYDAVQLAARAALLAGTTDGPSVAARIPEAAAAYRGVTGRIHFDAHGDRDSGNLAYYGLVPQGAGYEFRYYAYHLDGTGEFEILPQPESRTITFCPEC